MTARRAPRRRDLMTDDEYDAMLAAQGGVCAICGNPPKTRRLHVDHDHGTGAVRGLLCYRCNRVLAPYVTAEWLRRAARYLEPVPRAEALRILGSWVDELADRNDVYPTAALWALEYLGGGSLE